jgi:predicted RNA methylase
MAVAAVGRHAHLLEGHGLDWGAGSGLLAIAAARVPAVDHVVALEVEAVEVVVARANAEHNGVAAKVTFLHADSYRPYPGQQESVLEAMRGQARFLIANPPASRSGDGLDWRREALRGALEYLVLGAPVLLQISYQYSRQRIEGLVDDVPGYRYEGLAATSGLVPFDQDREDLRRQLVEYAAVEAADGAGYTFLREEGGHLTATEAMERFRATGASPMTRWQMHLYRRAGGGDVRPEDGQADPG